MEMEFIRLFFGLLIAFFHRPIADYVMKHERALVLAFRERGVPLPASPTTETARNIYFLLGIFVVAIELLRIYAMLHPETFRSIVA